MVSTPTEHLAFAEHLRSSTASLLAGLDASRWSDDDVRAPSLLPGWTRAHVLTHLARNADGITATWSGALRGEVVERYPGGPAQRDADIEAGAGRPVTELLADVRDSAERLDRVLRAVEDGDPAVWDRPASEGRTARSFLASRWREVEIHRVDLAGDHTPDRWPPPFVAWLLPELASTLGSRPGVPGLRLVVAAAGSVTTDLAGSTWSVGSADTTVEAPDWALLAWLVGRPTAATPSAPELPAWA